MSPTSKGGIAARAGRWSAQHRKTAIFGWLAVVIVAFMVGGNLGTKKVEQSMPGEAGRADRMLQDAFPDNDAVGDVVLVQNGELKATDAEYRAVVSEISEELGARPEVKEVSSPYRGDGGSLISPDRHSVQ